MYIIKAKNGDEIVTLHYINSSELALTQVLEQELNTSGTLSFQIADTHMHKDKLVELTTEIYVYDNEEEIFCGRIIHIQQTIYNTKSITCEGELAYLIDSQLRPYEYSGSIVGLLEKYLNEHNAMVEDRKKFYLGNVTVTDNNNYIVRSNENYVKTLTEIQDKLVKNLGGYLRIRKVAGKRYLDYLKDYGGENEQPIRFGENLLDITKYIDPTTIITMLIPVGAEKEDGTMLDIKSVNNGKDYIEDEEAIKKYGRICGYKQWEDVTVAANLLTKSKEYLKKQAALPSSLEVQAVDLGILDYNISKFKIGYWTKIISVPHNLEDRILLTKRTLDLENPAKSVFYLGQTKTSLTSSNINSGKEVEENIQSSAESTYNKAKREFNTAIKNANGLFQTSLQQPDGSTITYLHNKRNLTDSDIQIVVNSAGIAVSNDGGENWYGLEVDGDFIAKILNAEGINAEWVRTGTMQANRIAGGELVLGGNSNTSGIMLIKDSNGNVIGKWDKDGIESAKGVFSGEIRSSLGEIGGWSITNEGLESKKEINGNTIKVKLGGSNSSDDVLLSISYERENSTENVMTLYKTGYIVANQIYSNNNVEVKGDLVAEGSIRAASGKIFISPDGSIIGGSVTSDGDISSDGNMSCNNIFTKKWVDAKDTINTGNVFSVNWKAGITGTYTIGDKTIIVTGGIITSIN